MIIKRIIKYIRFSIDSSRYYRKQDIEYTILQLSHRLEKGLTKSNKKEEWGLEKSQILLSLLINLADSNNENSLKDNFYFQVGSSVLDKYLSFRLLEKNDDTLVKMSEKLHEINKEINQDYGGTVKYTPIKYDELAPFINVLNNRHSVRDFSKTKPNVEEIKKAIFLANRCPSACNRQAYRVHLITKSQRSELNGVSAYDAPYFLIITSLCSAYAKNEIEDGTVSASIFAGYLELTLNYYGINTCVIKKEIFNRDLFNDSLRKKFNFKHDEKVILEIAIGIIDCSIDVPISRRKNVELLFVNHEGEECINE